MPFRTKVHPININRVANATPPMAIKEAPKSRLRRLFEHQFSLKNFSNVDQHSEEFELSSICLRKMVERYIEDPENENQPRCGGPNHCNCFSGSGTDSSDEDDDKSSSSAGVLRSLKVYIYIFLRCF